jgi:hypothetical protein
VRTSLILSVVLHIVVVSAVLLNFSSSTSLDAVPQPLAVELVNPSDLTQVKAGKKDAPDQEAARSAPPEEKKPEPAPKAPEPKPVEKVAETQAAPPPPTPKAEPPKAEAPKSTEPPKPAETKPEPEKKAEAKPEPAEQPKREEAAKPAKDSPKPEKEKTAEAKPKKPEPKPEPKPESKPDSAPERDRTPFRDRIGDILKHPAEAERKPQPAPPVATKREFDPDRISALLNRDPKAGSPAAQDGPKEPWRKPSSLQDQAAGVDSPALPPREALGAPSGQDARMSASDIDYFRSQIARCWTPPVGGLGAEDLVVKLRIELKQDGSLARAPQVANSGSSPFFMAAADSATRAVLQCQPYSMPPEKFSQWRDMLLNFDPRQMYGG